MRALETRVGDDSEWQKALQEHERDVMELLEEADELGIKVGARQMLITQFYSPA